MPIHPDDPRLTDYALGELDDATRAELERELSASPDAQRALEEILRVTGLLSTSFADEHGLALDEARRLAILAGKPSENGVPGADEHKPVVARWNGMTTGRWIGAVVAAGLSGVILTAFVMETRNQSRYYAVATGVRAPAASMARTANLDALGAAVDNNEEFGARDYTNMPVESSPNATVLTSAGKPEDQSGGAVYETKTKELTSTTVTPPNDTQVALPFDEQEPIAYPDRETWVRLTKARQKYVAGDTAASAPSAVPQYGGYPGPGMGGGGGRPGGSPYGGSPYGGRGGYPARAPLSGEAARGLNGQEALADLITSTVQPQTWNEAKDGESLGLPVAPADSVDGFAEIVDDEFSTEAYAQIVENPFKQVSQEPLSTFSIDVDTASYANIRRFLTQSTLPPPGAVRIEEMINYFSYDYAQPTSDDPFAVHVEVAQCPWEAKHRLVRIGIQGREMAVDKRPPSNLVFLIDVSGSMQDANKLTLVKTGLRLLTEQLSENDRVAIVVYAGSSGQVLASTPGNQKETILASLDQLEAGGSTNGAGGIEQAYQVAVESFIKGGSNRVILCTDGDFNVGVTDESQLVSLIEGKAKSGVFLSVLGFGMGNYKDATLEKLSDKGNGNYAYIDTEREARKVLVEQLSGTLVTIAKDVKLQLEFNPARAAAYRLIGYENRLLAKEDFNDDKKDAGEIGAGHTVTALYEVIPAGEPVNTPEVDALEYQTVPGATDAAKQSSDLLMLKLRYKQPDGDTSKLMKTPVADSEQKIGQSSPDFQFASSVAAFGMLLRHSQYATGMNYGAVLELAQPGLSRDAEGYRAEFIELVKSAQQLSGSK